MLRSLYEYIITFWPYGSFSLHSSYHVINEVRSFSKLLTSLARQARMDCVPAYE